jgi:hypothetical protein
MKDLKHIKRFNESEENLNSELSKDSSSISDSDKVEMLAQIIEDFYINWKIGTLDNYLNKPERLKKITDIIYDKNREKNKGLF